ncbi:MAG: hypothetical protein WC528_02640 [Patescibacteria group bacterium]
MKKLLLSAVSLIMVFAMAGCAKNGVTVDTGKDDKNINKGQAVSQIDPNNKFGWLGGDENSFQYVSGQGAGWIRPHPGPFVWDMMQISQTDEIDFTNMDKTVSDAQKYGVNLLITIWPFANWDQIKRSNASSCQVSSDDEFLPQNDKKGRDSYLPLYRCNPNDWNAYKSFVTQVVERYDGDGVDDIKGLTYPIRYWEVMNEPDLEGGMGLDFYKQGYTEYAELLKNTFQAVKEADSTAQVLIAGAAGADSRFLNFYESMFKADATLANYFDIANIHCISNDRSTNSFNVIAYKQMLDRQGILKPIWVTEAEMMTGSTLDENAETTSLNVKNAIAAGASKIFFTRYDFADTRTDMSQKFEPSESEQLRSDELYRDIIKSNN